MVAAVLSSLDRAKCCGFRVEVRWVKGHSSCKGNEAADVAAGLGVRGFTGDRMEGTSWASRRAAVSYTRVTLSKDIHVLAPVSLDSLKKK